MPTCTRRCLRPMASFACQLQVRAAAEAGADVAGDAQHHCARARELREPLAELLLHLVFGARAVEPALQLELLRLAGGEQEDAARRRAQDRGELVERSHGV